MILRIYNIRSTSYIIRSAALLYTSMIHMIDHSKQKQLQYSTDISTRAYAVPKDPSQI